MRLTERLVQDTQNAIKRKRLPEDEETRDYLRHAPYQGELNRDKGVFVSEMERGINTDKSIFDRTAIFHTGK